MNCRVCGRAAKSDFCMHHQSAMDRVKEAYPLWAKAYGGMEWKAFLGNVKRNAQTGQWAREIAEFLEEHN